VIATHRNHLTTLSRIALLVAAGDYLTKDVASRVLAGDTTVFSHWLRFAVVHNPSGAFGFSAGAYTWQLNLALTLAAIALVLPVARDLARVDRTAPRSLGLIVGGALGNLVSLVNSPHGVVDFIDLRFSDSFGLVVNVADVAAYVGLALIVRTAFRIVVELRQTARAHLSTERDVMSIVTARREREVARRVYRDGPAKPGAEIGIVDWTDGLPADARLRSLRPPLSDTPIQPEIVVDRPVERDGTA
jgi:lipoprotein signal peptidase